MINKQYIAAINQLCVEKNLPREKVLDAVSAAIKTAYRKDYGSKEQLLDAIIDEDTGNYTIYRLMSVVDTIEDPETEFTLKDAKKYDNNAKIGDQIKFDVTPTSFGRIAAQAAKQVILQRIQEAEKDVLFDSFKEREDELVTAQISRIDRGMIYLEIDKNTIILPKNETVYSEPYHVGQRIKIYLEKVEKTTRGPRMIISRRTPKLIEKLFEFEIPEVKSKTVEIVNTVREPGVRTKISVRSNDPKVDPIGACVGQKGSRIQSIMEEVNREMIDVVKYSPNIEEYISNALSPAKISVMKLDEKNKMAEVYVEQDQRPLAIGRNGQNVQLASRLTGYIINLHDVSEYIDPKKPKEKEEAKLDKKSSKGKLAKKAKTTIKSIDQLDIPESLKKKLTNSGIIDIKVLRKMKIEDLTMIGGVGKASAEKIVKAALE